MTRRALGSHPVDRIVQRYVTTGERLGGTPSVDIVADSGVRCAYCEMDEKVGQRHEEDGTRVVVCGTCGRTWKGKVVHVLQGEIRVTPSVDAVENRIVGMISEWRSVRALVETHPLGTTQQTWDYAVAGYIAWLDPDIRDARTVVQWGVRFHPNVRWTINDVVRRITWVRRVVLKRLRLGGVVAEELGERELLGPVEGARLLGLPDPVGNGRKVALRLLKAGRIQRARNYGTGDVRGRWMAPRWCWEEFGGMRSKDNKDST